MRKLRLLVTGANGDLGRAMILYLSKFNFEIVATDIKSDLLCAPRSIRRYIVSRAYKKNYIEKINKIIDENKIDIALFESDMEIRTISKNIEKIKTNVWLPPFEIVKTMQDKWKCNKLWQKSGVPVPKSEIIKNKKHLRGNTWLRPLGYIGGGGKLAFYAKTKIDAKIWITKHKGWERFTISEYLPGTMFGFDSLWKNGELLGYSLKERLRYTNEGEELGYTSNVVKSSNNKLAIKTATRAILAIWDKPDGVFSVDMRENKNGIPCVTEINPGRFMTTSLLLFRETNFDLPLDYINLMLGKKIKRRRTIPQNKYLFFVKGLTRLVDANDMKIEVL